MVYRQRGGHLHRSVSLSLRSDSPPSRSSANRRQLLQKHVMLVPYPYRLLFKPPKSLLAHHSRAGPLLHHPYDLFSLPCSPWSWRRVEKLLHTPPTLATLPAADDAADIRPRKINKIQDPKSWYCGSTHADGRMASSFTAFPS